MPTTVALYIGKCQEVVDAKPKYKNGASDLRECDCIGMDKYAFRELGVKFSTTGSNYTLRHQVEDIRPIIGTSDLQPGEVVFKIRKPGEKGYDLPEKYQEGGSDYNGDLNDYYHIGTVISVYPLRIAHMTSPTAKIDTSIGKWAYAAKWLPQYVRQDAPAPDPEPEPVPKPEPDPGPLTALVWALNGKPVNLRKRPSRAAALVEKVPCGESVTVISEGDEWCKVGWRTKSGYMMKDFLIFPEKELYTVTIRHLTLEQTVALESDFPAAEVEKERG